MKGDVGMSPHEKERNKEMPTPRHRVVHNPIPTSLLCIRQIKEHKKFSCLLCHGLERNKDGRDGVTNDCCI